MLKQSVLSLWARNVQLAGYSIIIGLCGLGFTGDMDTIHEKGFFHGYTRYTWVVIALQALGGLTVATVIKYLGNIEKNFATTISVVFACLLSAAFLGTELSPTFMAGVVAVVSSIQLYNSKGQICCFPAIEAVVPAAELAPPAVDGKARDLDLGGCQEV